jgi:hypothetical protein
MKLFLGDDMQVLSSCGVKCPAPFGPPGILDRSGGRSSQEAGRILRSVVS